MTNEAKRLCPLNRMKSCVRACAWHNGQECSMFMLAQESFEIVEALRTSSQPIPIEVQMGAPETHEPQGNA